MIPIQVYVKEGETDFVSLEHTFDSDSSSTCSTIDSASINSTSPTSSNNTKPLGACHLCHQLLMLLSLKKHLIGEDRFFFVVKRINTIKPPVEFRQNCLRNLPAIIDPNCTDHHPMSSDHDDEILEYIDKSYPTEQLMEQCSDDELLKMEKASSEVFKRFNVFIKNVAKDSGQLVTALKELDSCLQRKGTQFALGNTITNFDTKLMPKLHQIRIAASYMRSFDIPVKFTSIWRYLHRAYHCPAFVAWCPSDQEIILNWTAKAALEKSSLKLSFDEKKRLIKSDPFYTFTVPN